MPTPEQIEDLTTTLRLIEESRNEPIEFPETHRLMVWGQEDFVTARTIEIPGLEEGTCGTAACLCGARALMDGARVLGSNSVRLPDGTQLNTATSWFQWGADRFGITFADAEVLFAFDNTMRQLRYYVQQIEEDDLPLVSVLDYDLELEGYEP